MKSYKEIEIGIKQRFKIGIVMCNFTLLPNYDSFIQTQSLTAVFGKRC